MQDMRPPRFTSQQNEKDTNGDALKLRLTLAVVVHVHCRVLPSCPRFPSTTLCLCVALQGMGQAAIAIGRALGGNVDASFRVLAGWAVPAYSLIMGRSNGARSNRVKASTSISPPC